MGAAPVPCLACCIQSRLNLAFSRRHTSKCRHGLSEIKTVTEDHNHNEKVEGPTCYYYLKGLNFRFRFRSLQMSLRCANLHRSAAPQIYFLLLLARSCAFQSGSRDYPASYFGKTTIVWFDCPFFIIWYPLSRLAPTATAAPLHIFSFGPCRSHSGAAVLRSFLGRKRLPYTKRRVWRIIRKRRFRNLVDGGTFEGTCKGPTLKMSMTRVHNRTARLLGVRP